MAPGRSPIGGVRNNWYDVLDLPGAWDMIHGRKLMESYDFYSRRPAPDIIVTEQTDIKDFAIATQEKDYAFVYLPNGNNVGVTLKQSLMPND